MGGGSTKKLTCFTYKYLHTLILKSKKPNESNEGRLYYEASPLQKLCKMFMLMSRNNDYHFAHFLDFIRLKATEKYIYALNVRIF